jgi:hypothetical protein
LEATVKNQLVSTQASWRNFRLALAMGVQLRASFKPKDSQMLKEALRVYIQPTQSASGKGLLPESNSIVDLVRVDAQLYCSEEEALAALTGLPVIFSDFKLPADMTALFNTRVFTDPSRSIPERHLIGRWFDQNKDTKYFVEATYEIQKYRRVVPKRPTLARAASWISTVTRLHGDEELTFVEDERQVISGFRSTVDLPYSHVIIEIEPVFPNLHPAECLVVPILSRTHLRLFWTFNRYEYSGWETRVRVGKLEWATDEGSFEGSCGSRAYLPDYQAGIRWLC